MISYNLAEVRKSIEESAIKAHRDPKDITLIAVTKLHTVEEINEAIACGVTDIGENKVQEILNKYDGVTKGVRWHLIGHLQTNKVKYIIDKVDLIHSVDSVHLAKEIDKQAKLNNKVMDILIQVNTANEESKFGVESKEAARVIAEILDTCSNVRIRGIMCIAPFAENPWDIQKYFEEARDIYNKLEKIENENLDFKYLSMGMSNDYEVAISCGANLVRIGTAIFGARDYSKKMA